ncbi:MAG: LytTR family transcriptional regulator DNA-binding domain-containing protein [Bacteroidota bacterium]
MSDGVVFNVVMSLCDIMPQLDPAYFYLCHQSHIVNANFVCACRSSNRGLLLITKNTQPIPVAVREVDAFRKFIKPFLSGSKK